MTETNTLDRGTIAQGVIGAWRLVSYVVADAEGHRSFPLGDDAHGIIIYTQSGHLSVQIGSTGRPQYQDGSPHGGTDAERAATAAGYLAYAGRYTVSDDGVVEHLPDVSLFPNWEHTTVPRKATIAHDRLTLELVEPLIIDGKRREASSPGNESRYSKPAPSRREPTAAWALFQTEHLSNARRTMTGALWLEDVHVGNRFRTDTYDLTADAIIEFATEWDPQPFHLGEDAAQDTFFNGLAASGWHTAAITMRLLVTTGLPLATGIIGASIELAWPSPTRPDDQLHVELEVTDVRVSKSDPRRGFITTAYDTLNQHGDVRQHTTARLLAFAKPQ